MLSAKLFGSAIVTAGLSTLLYQAVAHAQIYRYIDAEGVTHLTNHKIHPRYQPFTPSPQTSKQSSPSIDTLIKQIATQFNLDASLLHSIIMVESSYNPRAISPKGAIGLMQLMPDTAKRFGITKLFDPEQNIIAGARYLRFLFRLFNNNLPLVLAAYNAGEGMIKKYNYTIPPFKETHEYVKKVLKIYNKYTPSQKTFPISKIGNQKNHHA